MAISRYSNSESLIESKGRTSGVVWDEQILKFLNLKEVSISPEETPKVEMHIYSPTGNKLLTSVDVKNFIQRGDEIFIDYVTELNDINIQLQKLSEVAKCLTNSSEDTIIKIYIKLFF